MTAYENDTLIIPEELKKMSAAELKIEKEKLYTEIETNRVKKAPKLNYKKDAITFRF